MSSFSSDVHTDFAQFCFFEHYKGVIMKNLMSIFNLLLFPFLFLMRLFSSLHTDTQSQHRHSERGRDRFSSLRQHILTPSFRAISPILFIVLLLPLNLYAFKMESDSVTLHDTSSNPTFTTVTFRQTYDTIPIVVATATASGGQPCSVRIRNITVNGFDISQVEPANLDGMHASMTIDYVAIEPGVHELADGTKIEAGTRSTTTLQHGSDVLGSEGWDTINFTQTFSTAPTVLALIQGMANESNNPPAVASSPWLVTAIQNVYSGSMQIALERAEVNTGSVTSNETIGYIAIESNRQGTIGSIDYETRITADHISGWDNGCYSTSFNNTYASAPKVIATQNRHDGGDGGWVRICSKNSSGVGFTIDEDDYRDSERSHTTEAAGMVVFSAAFDIDAASNIYSCPGVVIPNLDGTSVSATDSFSSVTVPASTTYYYHFTPTVDGTIQTNSSASRTYNSLFIKNGCGANLWSNTANTNNKSSPAIAVAANQQIVIAFERRYTTSLTLDIDFTFTAIVPAPPSMGNIPDQTAVVATLFTPLSIASYVTEPNGDTITYSATGLPPGLTINATTGIITGTPTVAGTFNVTATATDTDGSASDPFNIIVSNPPLIAVDDSYSTTPGVSISGNLLSNDSGIGIELTSNTNPTMGTLAIGSSGDFTYTPDSSATGTDTFTYTITDDFGSTGTATVTIDIGTDYKSGVQPFTLVNPPNTRNVIGGYKLAGNTVMCLTEKTSGYGGTCHGQTDYLSITSNMRVSKYIDIDGNMDDAARTWNSTSSYIELPSTYDQRAGKGILWAGLFWQGRISNRTNYVMHYGKENGTTFDLVETGLGSNYGPVDLTVAEVNKIKLKVDNGIYNSVTAATIYNIGDDTARTYAAFANVTDILQSANMDIGKHVFTVANLTTNEGRESSPGVFGGWSLIVIYAEDVLNGSPRNISIYSGFDSIDTNNDPIGIGGFKLPTAGSTITANLSVFSGEGEYLYGRTPTNNARDTIQLSNAENGPYSNMPGASSALNVFDAVLDGVLRDDVTGYNNNLQVNNDGVDVDNFNVSSLMTGYRDADPNISEVFIKYYSDNDYITPSMIAFSTELYQPNICYDYTLDINGFIIPSDDNIVDTPFGYFGNDPLTTRILVKSKEGDFALHDVNITYRIHDTSQLRYINGSTAIAPNGVYNYIPAGPGGLNQTYNQTNQGFGMYIGEGAGQQPNGPGGIIDAYETRYFKFDNEMMQSSIDTRFDLWLEYTVDYGSGPLALVKNLDASSICQESTGYYPAWGMFNVSSDEADTSTGQPYNLYTQVSSRIFNARIFSYDTDFTTLKDANASIEVEVFNAGHFRRDTNVSCFNPDSNISAPVFVRFNEETSVLLPNLQYDLAIQNAGFRTWHLTAMDGAFIEHQCNDRNDETCFRTLYANEYTGDTFCSTECGSGGSGCYTCLRSYYGKPICSRDNFSIRPEAFVTQLKDSDQSTNTNDQSKSLAHSRDPSTLGLTNSSNLAAGYNYRFDINATNFLNDNATSGYIQAFNQSSSTSISHMDWSPPSGRNVTNCNDVDDKNISVTLYNGNSINTRTNQAAIDRVDQIGDYQFAISDENWTSGDWHPSLLQHHAASGFDNAADCIRDNNLVRSVGTSGQQGCVISSIHTHPSGVEYTALDLRFYPYTFNVNGLTIGAGPTNDKGFVYINTLDTALYPNGIDENMSYNIQGTFRATGYTGNPVNNFVDNCYADDVNMTLRHTYLSDIPNNTANLTADLIDYNTTNPSLTYPADNDITDRRRIPFNNALTKNVETGLTITQNRNIFEKDMQGAITMDLGFNFNRENNTTLNPRRINFSDFNITYASSPDINVDLKTDHQIFGNTNIDANITFLYARAKPGKEFYDDVTEANIDTPVSVVVYCDRGYTECQNRGILALFAQTNEADWWKSWTHDNQNTQDGNIELQSSPATALNKTSASIEEISGTEGEDMTINVSRGVATLPSIVPVNLVVNDPANPPAPANYTDRWLIYNEYNATQPPSPFYRVRFIGSSGWAGHGDTGNVVGGAASDKKNKRLEW